MELQQHRVVLWSDSTIVLGWIKKSSHTLKTFVANRVAQIQDLTAVYEWRYIPTTHNPADTVSRGSLPMDLKNNNLWWHGPEFLIHTEENWPTFPQNYDETLPEQKRTMIQCNLIEHSISHHINKFSALRTMVNITSYCLRFIKNCKTLRAHRTIGVLTAEELECGLVAIVKCVQTEEFEAEIRNLEQRKQVNSKSKIINLTPFLDQSLVIRVGGRLDRSNLSIDQKYQMLLPAKHHLTTAIFRHEHIKNNHAGPQLLLSIVRQKFWTINGKSIAKRIVHQCIRFFKS